VPALASNYNLQNLDLSGNLISALGGMAIALAFLNREMNSLDLSQNSLGASTNQIKKLHGIKKLHIGYNNEVRVVDGVQEF
jgi:Leucine Rich repeat